jgi:chromosome segregation ATPase
MAAPDLKTDSAIVSMQPEATTLAEFARTVVIRTADQYGLAARWLQSVKGLLSKIEDARTRVTRPLLEAQREVNAQAKEAAQPLLDAERQLKTALVAFQNEQERLRREEQALVEAEARRERERIEAQARETERKAREKAAADRRAADAAAAIGRVAEAAKLAARADATESRAADKAAALDDRAAAVVAPIIQREAPKVDGISTREVWKFEIVDPAQVPRDYLTPDLDRIGKVVKALKADCRIAGVRVYSERAVAAGRQP